MKRLLPLAFWYMIVSMAFFSGEEAGENARQNARKASRIAALEAPDRIYQNLSDDCTTSRDFEVHLEHLLSTVDPLFQQHALADLFASWLTRDPVAALACANHLAAIQDTPGRVAESFRDWASSHPYDAQALLLYALPASAPQPDASPAFRDGADSPVFLLATLRGLERQVPQLAEQTLEQLPPGAFQDAAREILKSRSMPANSATSPSSPPGPTLEFPG